MNQNLNLQNVGEEIVRLLVKHENDVRVEVIDMNSAVEITIQVHPSDTPRVIGIAGRNFRALRIILGQIAKKSGKHAYINQLPNQATRSQEFDAFTTKEDWSQERVLTALERTLQAMLTYGVTVEAENASDKTRIDIRLSAREPESTTEIIHNHVRTIFNAICRKQGRVAVMDIFKA